MKEPIYETPVCTSIQIELRSCVLGASNESYSVNHVDDPFGEEE